MIFSPFSKPVKGCFNHSMKKVLYTTMAAFVLAACQTTTIRPEPIHKSAAISPTALLFKNGPNRQIVVVTTADWHATQGVMSRFEWVAGHWQQIGSDIPVVVGKTGLAWGMGLYEFPRQENEPKKREGDNKAPAGLFRLPQAMGYAQQEKTQIPYTQATMYHACVDDAESLEYNHIVDIRETDKTWNSCEKMKRDDEQYRYVVLVDHNGAKSAGRPVPGKGSCIFMHVWRSQKDGVAGTAGCTAMSAKDAAEFMHWLKPEAILVQLPRDVYLSSYKKMGLPMLSFAGS